MPNKWEVESGNPWSSAGRAKREAARRAYADALRDVGGGTVGVSNEVMGGGMSAAQPQSQQQQPDVGALTRAALKRWGPQPGGISTPPITPNTTPGIPATGVQPTAGGGMSGFMGKLGSMFGGGAGPTGGGIGGASAGGGGSGMMSAAMSNPITAIVAAVIANETYQRKKGNRPEGYGAHLGELLTGKVLERDADRYLGDKAGDVAAWFTPHGAANQLQKGFKKLGDLF